MEDQKINTLKWLVAALFAAGFGCLYLDYRYSWVSGLLFMAAASLWLIVLVKALQADVTTFDKKLASRFWEQVGLLFSAVAILFFFTAGLVLLFHPDFDSVWSETSGSALLHLAHRFFGYNYYDDLLGLNLFLFLMSVVGTIFLGGMLITTLSNIVQQRKENVENGLVAYRKLNNHSIIIGSGSFSPYLIRQILTKNPTTHVLLMTNKVIPEVRSRLRALLTTEQMDRVILISGDMTSPEDISDKLVIPGAKEVFVMGESGEYGLDSKNIECTKSIAEARGEGKEVLPVYLHLKHMSSNNYLKSKNSNSPLGTTDLSKRVFLRPFNFNENWGRLLWGYNALRKADTKERRYAPLNFAPITETNHVHLVVVGLNSMGAALVLQAARICHFPRFTGSNRTVISIIEKDQAIIDEFRSLYPRIEQLDDVEIRFEKTARGVLHTFESFQDKLRKLAKDDNTLLTITICYRDPDQAISAALRLPEEVYYRKDRVFVERGKVRQNNMRTQVLVRQEYDSGIGLMLDADTRYRNFHIFGMLGEGLDVDLQDDTLAKLAKDSYERFLTNAFRDDVFPHYMADMEPGSPEGRELAKLKKTVEEQWHCASEWDRMSNRYQVDMYQMYLDALEEYGLLARGSEEDMLQRYMSEGYYRLYNEAFSHEDGTGVVERRPSGVPDYDVKAANALADIEHRRWMAERLIAGWRAPLDGEDRLDEFRIHPSIQPYSALDDREKYKDITVLRNVPLLDAIKKKMVNG